MRVPFISSERSEVLLDRLRHAPARTIHLTFHGLGTPPLSVTRDERDYFLAVDEFERILDDVRTWDHDVRLSFDDAFESDFRIALPVLLRRGLTATFFLPTQKLGEPGRLSEKDVLALHCAGMTIGSHGVHHVRWTGLKSAALTEELKGSRACLENMLQARVEHAACPFGAYNRRVLIALRRAGYRRVYTCDGGFTPPGAWLIPRTTVRANQSAQSLRDRVGINGAQRLSLARRTKLAVKRWR